MRNLVARQYNAQKNVICFLSCFNPHLYVVAIIIIIIIIFIFIFTVTTPPPPPPPPPHSNLNFYSTEYRDNEQGGLIVTTVLSQKKQWRVHN